MTVQERLKSVRETHGKTQKEMAILLGISPRTWQDYEGGVNVPGWKVLEGLARLQFNVNWILTDKGTWEIECDKTNIEEHKALRYRLRNLFLPGNIPRFENSDNNGYVMGGYDSCVSETNFHRYISGLYLPTTEELNYLCKVAGDWNFEEKRVSELIAIKEFEERKQAIEQKELNKQITILKKTGNRIAVELLKEVTTVIEEALHTAAIKLEPARKAELFALVYDYAAESEENRAGIAEQVQRLLRLIGI
jgi:transcriptional regulator with XRE-family HTH domain